MENDCRHWYRTRDGYWCIKDSVKWCKKFKVNNPVECCDYEPKDITKLEVVS